MGNQKSQLKHECKWLDAIIQYRDGFDVTFKKVNKQLVKSASETLARIFDCRNVKNPIVALPTNLSKNAVESVLDYLHGNSLEVNVDDKERKKLYIAAKYLDVQNIIDDLKIVCEANELTLDEPKLTKI